MENINLLCRTCGSSTQEGFRQYIFESENIPSKLNILSIEVTESDPLPKVICKVCVCKLDMTYEFVMKMKNTQHQLNNLVHYQDTVIKVEPDMCDYSAPEHCQMYNKDHESQLGTHFLASQPHDATTEEEHRNVTQPCPPLVYYGMPDYNSPANTTRNPNTNEPVREVHKKDKSKKKETECPVLSKSVTETKASTSKSEKSSEDTHENDSSYQYCLSCNLVFPSSESLDFHSTNHNTLPECLVCGVKFRSTRLLGRHTRRGEHSLVTEDGKVWRCGVCDKQHKKRSKIVNHMRVHTKERPFTCNLCQNTFRYKSQLTMHERKHNNDWCYVCNYCGKGFFVKVYFDNHVRTVHTKEKPFKCDKCNSTYASKVSLREHIISKHNDGTLPVKVFECKSCGKKFKDNNSLYYHNKTHAAPLEERRKHKCLVCNASFVKNHYLKKHMKVHTGENVESFDCHLCGKKLATSHGLELHLVIHSGVKNFICDFCGKAFASDSTLKTHIRCHTGEKPYQCRVCANFFTQRSSLLSHLKNIHNIDDRVRKINYNRT